MALMPAVPPPMIRCRVAILRSSSPLASPRGGAQLARFLEPFHCSARSAALLTSHDFSNHFTARLAARRCSPRTATHQDARRPLVREVAEPVERRRLLVGDRGRGARLGTRRCAAAEVALERLPRVGVVEHRAVRAGDRAELAADARAVEDALRPGGVERDGADRARRHTPPLRALRAGVGRVRGVALEGRDADDRFRRLERGGLRVGAGQLAAQTARALLRMDLEDSHRFFLFPGTPPSRRPMNSSSGIAAIVMPAAPPRAPSSTETREIVALSGASITLTKS